MVMLWLMPSSLSGLVLFFYMFNMMYYTYYRHHLIISLFFFFRSTTTLLPLSCYCGGSTAQGDKRYTTVSTTTKACAQTSQGTRSAHICKRVVSYCSAEPVTVPLGSQDAPGASFAANKRRCVRPKWKTSSRGFHPLHFCCRWRRTSANCSIKSAQCWSHSPR